MPNFLCAIYLCPDAVSQRYSCLRNILSWEGDEMF